MHEYFAHAIARDRRARAEALAAVHRVHVAGGSDLTATLLGPALRAAERAGMRLAARRADADAATRTTTAVAVRAA